MRRLDNPVQRYAWGSRTAIPALLGQPAPADEPWAELWMGAHPRGPSRLVGGPSLDEHIAADPRAALGAEVAAEFGGRLPFLFKVLAADAPLSLQAHPSAAAAAAGFAAEEAAGVPRDAPHRNYRDPHHKPELLCALTEFHALCGFRPVAQTLALLDELAVPALDTVRAELVAQPGASGLRTVFEQVLRGRDASLVAALATAAGAVRRGPFAFTCAQLCRLAAAYPGDAGVVAALLLNAVTLQPGEAVFLSAGNLHAYLGGVGVELMASSDNVLRGGLTIKHVDVDELLRVVDFEPLVFAPLRPAVAGVESAYDTPAPEFRLSRIELDQAQSFEATGPEILLCVRGRCEATDRHAAVTVSRGGSVFVSPGRYTLEPQPRAQLFRARVGLR